MSIASLPRKMTVEEFLALPDDPEVERMLINGELWEKPMTRRNRFHARTETRIAYVLENWVERTDQPLVVYSGEAGVRLPSGETVLGIDVTVVTEAVASRQSDESTLIEGVPILAVEILSPSDSQREVVEKINTYLAAGVKLVWIVEPMLRMVTVHRPDGSPETYSGEKPLRGEPHLPGFEVPAEKLFDR